MNRQPAAQPDTDAPYVRPSLIEAEPVVFALALVALVMAISLWRPTAQVQPQQAAPAEPVRVLAAAPSR